MELAVISAAGLLLGVVVGAWLSERAGRTGRAVARAEQLSRHMRLLEPLVPAGGEALDVVRDIMVWKLAHRQWWQRRHTHVWWDYHEGCARICRRCGLVDSPEVPPGEDDTP